MDEPRIRRDEYELILAAYTLLDGHDDIDPIERARLAGGLDQMLASWREFYYYYKQVEQQEKEEQ